MFSLCWRPYGNASFRSFWSLLSLPLQHLATVLCKKEYRKVLAGSMWSVVKTKTTMPWQTLICRLVLTWLRTTVRSFFLKCLEPSHRRIETRYDTCWIVEKISVSVPTDTRILSITAKDGDPKEAARIANGLRNVAAEKIIAVTRYQMLRPWMKQKCLNHLLHQISTQCPSWLYCWSGLDGGSHGRGRSLGRSCQETRRYRRVDGLNHFWYSPDIKKLRLGIVWIR